MTQFSITAVFSDFESCSLSRDELEELIKEALGKDCDRIKEIKYSTGGIEVILNDGETVEIEIDWDEIILK